MAAISQMIWLLWTCVALIGGGDDPTAAIAPAVLAGAFGIMAALEEKK